jgi:beta-xylosidase
LTITFLAVASAAAQRSSADVKLCNPAPALDSDFPDPSILIDPALGPKVFAYGTNIAAQGPTQPGQSGGMLNAPFSRSEDSGLTHWTTPVDALPRLPAWAKPGFTWAPDVIHRPGEPYRLYFTARYGFSGRPCIGVAQSPTPEGPFVPTSETKPLVCPLADGGAIDPSVFRDDDGAEYLLWKTDSNCCSGEPAIYLQRLSPDGLALEGPHGTDAPWILSDATLLIKKDQPWEGQVVEAPSLIKHAGRYYLFYSGGYYGGSSYAVGYASADRLLGPYKKASAPLLSAANGLSGPGGQDVFTGPDGSTMMAFHAWRESPQRHRALYVSPLEWDTNGPVAPTDCTPP